MAWEPVPRGLVFPARLSALAGALQDRNLVCAPLASEDSGTRASGTDCGSLTRGPLLWLLLAWQSLAGRSSQTLPRTSPHLPRAVAKVSLTVITSR